MGISINGKNINILSKTKIAKIIEQTWTNEAIELSTASYGYQMVTTIGKI
jgi:hypothetical protein